MEFVNNINKLNKLISKTVVKLPHKKIRYVCKQFTEDFKQIYQKIYVLSGGSKKLSAEVKCEMIKGIIDDIQGIQVSYDAFCVGGCLKENKRDAIADMLNHEINVLTRMARKIDTDYIDWVPVKYITNYKYESMNKAIFVRRCIALFNCIYTLVADARKDRCPLEREMLATFANIALSSVFSANKIFPKTHEQYEQRMKYLDNAISNLHAMNPCFIEIFKANNFSEYRIKRICRLLSESITYVSNIRESDKKRFKDLP